MDDTQPGNPWPMAMGMTGLALFTLVGGTFFILFAAKPKPVPAPKSFAVFNATDGSFKCLYPSDWKKRGAGTGGIAAIAEFKMSGANIKVASDLAGSLMGDIAKATGSMGGMGGEGGAPQKSPVEGLHASEKEDFEDDYPGYDEKPAVAFQSGAGEGRITEFTSKGNFITGKLHGYRATILGGERRITVEAVCPEGDWSKLNPAFKRVIASITAGSG